MTTSTNTTATAPAKKTLGWSELNKLGRSYTGKLWFPCLDIAKYFDNYRIPSPARPDSYARAAMTVKFNKLSIVKRGMMLLKGWKR